MRQKFLARYPEEKIRTEMVPIDSFKFYSITNCHIFGTSSWPRRSYTLRQFRSNERGMVESAIRVQANAYLELQLMRSGITSSFLLLFLTADRNFFVIKKLTSKIAFCQLSGSRQEGLMTLLSSLSSSKHRNCESTNEDVG